MKLNIRNVVINLILFLVALSIAWYGQPFVHGNADAVNILVTLYSILAGVLIAVITIIGDPVFLVGGKSWRYSEIKRKDIITQLRNKRLLFFLYLITLVLILITKIFPATCVTEWSERGYLFLSFYGLYYSFRLPSTIMKAQEEKLDQFIEHRRNEKQPIPKIDPDSTTKATSE